MGAFRNIPEAEKRSRMSAAAKIIFLYKEGRPLKEIYKNISAGYEALLDVFGNSEAAAEVSRVLRIPEVKIRTYAGQLIDLLLFNKENDPYISFGLPKYGSSEDVNRRWKRLMFLYHPDRYSNQKGSEERAKKINEVYEKLQFMKRSAVNPERPEITQKPVKPAVSRRFSHVRIRHFKYLKYLPHFILALVVIAAIISIVFFVSYVRNPDGSSNEGQRDVSGITEENR